MTALLIKKLKHSLARLRDAVLPAKFDGWLRVYLTLECNLDCAYCVHNHNRAESKALSYTLTPWQEWARFLNAAKRNVVFTGGEPFLYPDIVPLLNALDPSLEIKVYTNFSADMDAFIKDCSRQVTFFGTYHPSSGPVQKFIDRINAVRSAGKFKGSIHMVGWKNQLSFVQDARKLFDKHGWYVYIDDDQYLLSEASSLKFKKDARCSRRIYLIAPDGTRHQCVSKMLRRDGGLGNVFADGLGADLSAITCPEYGFCSPCDNLGETSIKPL